MWHWQSFPFKVWLVIPLLSLAFLAVACGAAATPAPPPTPAPKVAPQLAAPAAPVAAPRPTPVPAAKVHPGKLTIMVGDWLSGRFDNAFVGGGPAVNYGRILGGFLVSDNENRAKVPGIASQWGLSPDGAAWDFTIRKGVKFHDGAELTPQDVVWTLQHYFGPQAPEYATGSSPLALSRAIDKIELSGPDGVRLTAKQALIFNSLDFSLSEAGEQWYQIMPKRAKLHDTEEEAAYDNNPIGAGPMRLAKHIRGSVMKFERFDDFYYQPKNGFPEDKRVNFQSLDLFLAPEEATRAAAIRAGEADIVPASLATKKQVEAGGGRLVFGREGVYVDARLIGCYEPRYPCHDKRVRQALNYAMDKELIRDRLYGGPEVFQAKGWAAVTPSTIGYTPQLDPWPFDPNKARQLLADAGYPGGKGFGKFIVNTHPSTALPFQVEAAQLAAEFWRRELGLDVEVKVVDRVAIRKQDRTGELNGQIYWRDNDTRISPENTIDDRYGDPKAPVRVHEDPELFRIVQETIRILDPDKRAEALKKLFPRLRDESYHFGVGYANIPWAVGPRVLTWQPYPLALYPSALHTITLK